MASKKTPKGEPYPTDPTIEKWEALPTHLTGFEKAIKAVDPFVSSFAKRAQEFVNSSLFADLQRMAAGMVEAEANAKLLSTMMHSADEDLDSIEKYLAKNPINAHTLMSLISMERRLEVSEAEKKAATEKSKLGAELAKKRWDADPTAPIKIAVREHWDMYQADKSRYSGVTAFDRDMASKYEEIKDHRTFARWRKEWGNASKKKDK